MLQILHDGQGHQGIERTTAMCRQYLYWNTTFRDVAQYVKDCLQCHMAKGPYIGTKTQPGSIVANEPLDLLCVDFVVNAYCFVIFKSCFLYFTAVIGVSEKLGCSS